MLIDYYKGEPSTYLIGYAGGRVNEFGSGRSLWYMPHNTTLAAVPILSQVTPFIFKEATANFQEVSIQGQLTYRLTAPMKAAEFLDFTITEKGAYRSKDLDKLTQRIINTVQAYIRSGVNALDLENALGKVKDLSGEVLLEVRKALEAEYRENLQKRADQAIYDRRFAAQDEERKIRQRELDGDVELEERRRDLVNKQAENGLVLAEAEAKADQMKLNPYSELAPQALVGLALKEWAANAGTVENLSIGADMLGQLIGWMGGRQDVSKKR